ncbi:putative membrane protein YhhN [Kordia periserrulae]|uniref:Putative membrane protein YhhN n=1 Tax=Kordia periserrulae TaxID=701523 RepID=A0A2T6C163_9FLAO|nr:lysoplasmalogenase [Kordia periserrulae]PTX62049.1 putative membrane protein YhhN [Kordia periserrulae]
MKFFKVFIIIFLLNLSLDIYFNNAKELYEYRIVTKPLITILLAIFFYINSQAMLFHQRLIILGALAALCIGDILLLEETSFYSFILGLVLFLISMLLYSLYFYKQVRYDIDRLIPYLAVSLLLSLSLIYLIYDKLDNLLIPVIIYMITVLNFLKIGYLRYKNVNTKSYRLVFWGIACFTIAQIVIGLNQFHNALPYKDVYIMLFYGTSQLLIILGILTVKFHTTENAEGTLLG